jgi:hypothetical protein
MEDEGLRMKDKTMEVGGWRLEDKRRRIKEKG